MSVSCTGICQVEIEETGEKFTVIPKDIEFESVNSEERGMGIEIIYEADYSFFSKIKNKHYDYRWTVSEYPLGMLNFFESEGHGVKVVKDFDIGIENNERPDDNG